MATPAQLMAAFTESPAHRRTLLYSRFRDAGVGITLGAPLLGVGGPSATVTRRLRPSLSRLPGHTSPMALCDEVRTSCARIAAGASWVHIDLDAVQAVAPAPPPPLDARVHYLEGTPADVATYMLTVDAVNFGSGWFPTLNKRPGCSGYMTIAWAIADRFRAGGAWSNDELRAMRADELADDARPAPRPRADGALRPGAARARAVPRRARRGRGGRRGGGSAERFATMLASGMTLFADRGFYKRAQIAAADLALAGVASFGDLHRLTIFADNLVPHVLRCDGVLRYDERLAAHIDAGLPLRPGQQEREIRACAVHACELIAQRSGVAPYELDNWLWNRGQEPAIKATPRHRCRTVYY